MTLELYHDVYVKVYNKEKGDGSSDDQHRGEKPLITITKDKK